MNGQPANTNGAIITHQLIATRSLPLGGGESFGIGRHFHCAQRFLWSHSNPRGERSNPRGDVTSADLAVNMATNTEAFSLSSSEVREPK
jgi:hypothetical protein